MELQSGSDSLSSPDGTETRIGEICFPAAYSITLSVPGAVSLKAGNADVHVRMGAKCANEFTWEVLLRKQCGRGRSRSQVSLSEKHCLVKLLEAKKSSVLIGCCRGISPTVREGSIAIRAGALPY